ncbi:MAG: nucleotide exchange factor GrpE [Candidatus Pristimantibacillus sp.]
MVSKEHNETVEEIVIDEQTESTVEETELQEDPRLVELEKQAEESQQRYLRAQADFDNFRRRTMKEKEELAQYASMKLIEQLLPVVDNFERAVAAASVNGDFESLAKGVDMIFRQLDQTLQQEGLKAMEVVGEPFNPEFHQAVMTVESDEHEEGIIVEEMQKGYILKDKVLRPAMVKVSG